MHNVGSPCAQDHLLVGLVGIALAGGDKATAEIGQVSAEQLGGEDFMTIIEAASQQQSLVEELANLGNQGKRAPGAGMSASASGHCDQAVYPRFGGFLRVAAGGHIMEDQAAVTVHRIHYFLRSPQAGDHHWDLVLHTDGQVGLQARVAAMHDQIHRIGRRIGAQAGLDFFQPGFEAAAVTLVERGEAAHYATVAAGQNQRRC